LFNLCRKGKISRRKEYTGKRNKSAAQPAKFKSLPLMSQRYLPPEALQDRGMKSVSLTSGWSRTLGFGILEATTQGIVTV